MKIVSWFRRVLIPKRFDCSCFGACPGDAGADAEGRICFADKPIGMIAYRADEIPADLVGLPGGRFMKLELSPTSGDHETTFVLRGIDVRFQCQIKE